MTVTLGLERREITVRGIVQGVGFRPFVYGLAERHGLAGSVHNDSQGVSIAVEGTCERLDLFLRSLQEEVPVLAVVEHISWEQAMPRGEHVFRIDTSRGGGRRNTLVSPDVATCDDCLRELFEPADRRYRYPFTNCTNCGPRFTIIHAVPYDRAATGMAGFRMCSICQAEYDDPTNRRFHAQPNACPGCGPRARLLEGLGSEVSCDGGDPIAWTAQLLRDGAIVAVKGLGGYHLACDPINREAVAALRDRKARPAKPFAVMTLDSSQARSFCTVDPQEEELLSSPARPIVLLRRLPHDALAPEVAPRQRDLGMMLAYTPLHHLLLHDMGGPLVMTSGNRANEPIVGDNDVAVEVLRGIADYFLVHDRPIHVRCDDSVVRRAHGRTYPLRRSRGYAPRSLLMSRPFAQHTLACGAELKSTFCLARERYAFPSHHIGDLRNYGTLRSFRESIAHYSRLFDVRPEIVAHDLHPEYLSTRHAHELEDEGLIVIGVQHHHAHIASCLVDNERAADEQVIGVAWDGTGYGSDGTIWGGEFFQGSIADGFARRAHLAYSALPGGEAAIREPWRVAVAQLLTLYSPEDLVGLALPCLRRRDERTVRLIGQMVGSGVNAPQTSSAGRLFDAVAALLDLPGTDRTTYEGQAAIELEMAAGGWVSRAYPFQLRESGSGWIVETGGIVAGVLDDMGRGMLTHDIASGFHRTMAEIIRTVCMRMRETGGAATVVLSGGTFGNMLLLQQAVSLLEGEDFTVYTHHRVPANDGGLALGQAVLADSVFRQRNG